jgi:DNA segregation ATPase FtsK/SpoIIIE-like protein
MASGCAGSKTSWSERTAQRYILVAELAKTDKLSDLSDEPLSALVSAPAAVPTSIDRTPAGQPITVAFMRKTKDAQSTAVPVTITRVEQRHSTPTPVMNARESARQYAEELKAKRDAKNAADIAEYQAKREAYKTPENWRVNAVDAAKNAIDLPDFWTAVYGEKWRHFAADDEIVALARHMGRDRTTAPHNVKLTLHHARKARLACYVSYELQALQRHPHQKNAPANSPRQDRNLLHPRPLSC